MIKRYLLLWIFIGLLITVQSQVITIKDSETDEAIAMATLNCDETNVYASTNSEGRVDISIFNGADKIVIRSLGYNKQTKSYAELVQESPILSLVPNPVSIDAVVVSATRWNQPVNDIPVRIKTISSKQISIENPQTSADLLASSGEVYIQKSQQGGGSPMIRGFATNRLLYIVDGVRMNTAIFRGGNIQNVISLDPFEMQTVEVCFGSGSVIYGSDAIGGVMNFQTKAPEFSLDDKVLISGNAASRYSSANNENTKHLDINIGWKKWASITSISSNDFGDLKMGSHGPDEYLRPFYVQRQDSLDITVTNDDPLIQRPSGYTQMNMMQKLRFKPNDRWDIQYGLHYSETSNYSRYDRHIRYKNGLPRYGEWYYGPQKWMMNDVSITHSGLNHVYDQMTFLMAYQNFEESRISRDFNHKNREVRVEKVDAYSINLDFVKFLKKKHKLYYGLEFVMDDVYSKGKDEDIIVNISSPGPSRYPQSTWSSMAAYLTDKFEISDQFMIQAGVRFDQYFLDTEFDTSFYPFPFTTAHLENGNFTGSLGFVYKHAENLIINGNLSTGFRSPNVDDVGKVFDSEPGSVVVPNPDLQAEYAYSVSLGIVKKFNNIVKIDATGYYTILENALVRRDYTLNGLDSIVYDGTMSKVQAIQNAAVANVYGFQAGLECKLIKGFGLSSHFNYQIGEEELDDGTKSPSRHAPPRFGQTKLIYSANKLDMQFYIVYNGEMKYEDLPEEEIGKDYMYAIDNNGNPYSPGWYTLNIKAMYKFAENFTISGGMENLTDQRYRPYSSGIAAPGRNLILSLVVNF